MFKLVSRLLVVAIGLLVSPAMAEKDPVLGHQLFGIGPEKVIILHDWMGDSANYSTVRPWLDPKHFTYAFTDVRGYGRSRDLTGEYTSDEIADDIMRLANKLGWKEFHLVGHSMNGLAGFKAIMNDWQAGRRIKSFVAVTPVTPDGYPATEQDKAFLEAAILDDDTAGAAFGALTGGKLNGAWSRRKTTRNRATSNRKVLKGYYDMWTTEDFSREFAAAKVGTPVLVIGGRNDLPGFQEAYYAKTLSKWLPHVSFTYIENAGHFPMYETPVLFATLVESHMNVNQ